MRATPAPSLPMGFNVRSHRAAEHVLFTVLFRLLHQRRVPAFKVPYASFLSFPCGTEVVKGHPRPASALEDGPPSQSSSSLSAGRRRIVRTEGLFTGRAGPRAYLILAADAAVWEYAAA